MKKSQAQRVVEAVDQLIEIRLKQIELLNELRRKFDKPEAPKSRKTKEGRQIELAEDMP